MAIRAILFDKDGTLLDFHATWMPVNRTAALNVADGDGDLAARMLLEGGQDDTAGHVRPGSVLAAGNTEEIASVWTALMPEPPSHDLVEVIDAIFQREGREAAVAVPGLTEVVARLSERGWKLGIATSDSREGANASLERFEVLERFDFIAGYDSGFGVKPAPGMVHAFCRHVGLAPSSVAVVGDNLHDLEMGRSAGAGLVVGVLSGTGVADELEPKADRVVDSIADLETVLDERNGGTPDAAGNGRVGRP